MTYTEKLRVELSTAKIHSCVEFEGISIVPELATSGCKGCVFQTEEKANVCMYKSACMSHERADRYSLIFTNKR